MVTSGTSASPISVGTRSGDFGHRGRNVPPGSRRNHERAGHAELVHAACDESSYPAPILMYPIGSDLPDDELRQPKERGDGEEQRPSDRERIRSVPRRADEPREQERDDEVEDERRPVQPEASGRLESEPPGERSRPKAKAPGPRVGADHALAPASGTTCPVSAPECCPRTHSGTRSRSAERSSPSRSARERRRVARQP